MPSTSDDILTVARSREQFYGSSLDLVYEEEQEMIDGITFETPESNDEKMPQFRSISHKKRYAIVSLFALIGLIALAAYTDRLVSGESIARGVSISDINVGSMSNTAATKKVLSSTTAALATPMVFTLGNDSISVSADELGLSYDVEKSVERAYDINRSYMPWDVIPSFVQRTSSGVDVDVVARYDKEKFEDTAQSIVNELSRGRANAGVEITGTSISVIKPKAGKGVTARQAKNALSASILSLERKETKLSEEKVEAQISLSEAQQTASILATMFSRNSILTSPAGNTLVIDAEQLAAAVKLTPNKSNLDISIDESILRPSLGEQLPAMEVAPQDASFAVSGSSVSVVEGIVGKKVDFASAVKQWEQGNHEFLVGLVDVQPERNSEWARNLNITELVSTYTTNFPAGQERVKNIRRAAEVVNNSIVEPGDAFSLNEKLGPRTAEAGYVRAPVFAESKGFFDDFGGGVSQFATTMFNTYYFGGYKDIAHKPHTIYISRYPMGREATLNYGSVDLKFRNDSTSGILIRTSVSSTSVTVSFYGNKEGRKVETEGPHVISQTPYETQYVDDPSLVVGQEKQLQAGYPGIVVENYRTITRPNEEAKRERFRWSYTMVPRKIARGTKVVTTPPSIPAA